MKIAITGGAGFVGSSLGIHLKTTHPNYEIIAFDNLRRRGSELNISRLKEHQITLHQDLALTKISSLFQSILVPVGRLVHPLEMMKKN